jgi:predicted Zn-dependent protease with MMP-like domain/Flp pilus assembly protein TadD
LRDLSPTVDEGWLFLEEGNFVAARGMAKRALGEDPDDSEALLLLAACCRAEGDPQEALHHLERASTADDAWCAPAQWTAEILAQDLDRPADALKHAARALDRADEEDEFLDAVVLKAGLEIQLGKTKAAQTTLSELPGANEVQLPAELSLDLAYLFLEAELVDEAEQRFRALVDTGEQDAEAWYGLGLCAEARSDESAKRTAWLCVLEMDGEASLPKPLLGESEMAEIAESSLAELPEHVRQLIANVPILIVDLPARTEVESGLDPRLLGLFEGTAYTDAAAMGGPAQVTQILLFRKNLERMAIDADDLREQIRITLLHETGHFFGMSEDDLADVGLD